MQALAEAPAFPDDWLIVAGDVAESMERLNDAFGMLRNRFAKIIWVPGNHELWTVPGPKGRGAAKYEAVVDLARSFGILTPEDPYPVWEGEGGPCVVCPLFSGVGVCMLANSFGVPTRGSEKLLAHSRRSCTLDIIPALPA